MKKRNICLWILLCMAAVVLILQLLYMYQSEESEKKIQKLDEQIIVEESADLEIVDSTESEDVPEPSRKVYTYNQDAANRVNDDIIGWIIFEQEDISYPILYSGDDSYYLRRNYDGTRSSAGSIFMEGLNSPDFNDCHTIIYGHNMRNGSMFGKLKNYLKDGYYENHQYFTIVTAEGSYQYHIFAYSKVDKTSDVYSVPYAKDQVFTDFIQYLKDTSDVQTDVNVANEDKIITLSTCSTNGKRFVVHAVRE